jgi:hypothetical protein
MHTKVSLPTSLFELRNNSPSNILKLFEFFLAYLMKHKQMSLREAFHHLRARRHIVGPNFGFIKQVISLRKTSICFFLSFCIIQLITYERSLFGFTSVSFVNTAFGSVPDIYLSMPTSRPRRQPTSTIIPVQTTHNHNTLGRTPLSPSPQKTTATIQSSPTRSSFLYSSSPALSIAPRQYSFVNRSTTSALPTRATTTISSYPHAYNHGASSNSNNRPVSSSSIYQNHNPTAGSNGYMKSSTLRQLPEQARINSTLGKPFDLTREYFIPTKINSFRTVKYVPSSYNRYHLQ